jgi:hypothetical protein
MHVLIDDGRGQLILKRLWPWDQVLAGGQAARLDRELAAGTSPETSASLAARAARLTSTGFRRDLAASLRRILVAAEQPARPVAAAAFIGPVRALRVPLRTTRISRSAPQLAGLASRLLEPGPVPVRGVALVVQLLTDGTGPLYREAARGDLGTLAEQAARALDW